MIKVWEFLSGKKTYIMAAIIGLDAAGTAMGWWEEARIREVAEGIFTLLAVRAGIAASGPVVK
jgi:hypothetical protein